MRIGDYLVSDIVMPSYSGTKGCFHWKMQVFVRKMRGSARLPALQVFLEHDGGCYFIYQGLIASLLFL